MAEKINLAQFDIDVDSLIKDTITVKQRIDEIKEEMKLMTKEGKTSSEAFINNAVSLKELNKEYNSQIKILGEINTATGKTIPLQQQLDSVMQREVKTINDLRKQNTDLLKTRNNVNLATEEGRKQIELINAKYDENIQLIKANVSEREQEQMSIGGYTNAIKEALGQTGLMNQTMGQSTTIINNVQAVFQSFTPIFNQFNTELNSIFVGFQNATKGAEGMTASQKLLAATTAITTNGMKLLRLALISTGIGAIVVAVGSLVAYLASSEQASNKLSKAFSSIGGIIQRLLKYLYPLGEFLLDVIVDSFTLAGRVATATLDAIANGLAALGFDKAANSVRRFTNELSNASKESQALADAEATLVVEQRKANAVMLEGQRQAERLRQVRDDENKTMAERIKANEGLGVVLEKQLATEKQIALQALAVANLRIAQDGRNAGNLDAQAEAMEKILDIEERITGQQSEQLTNRVSLQNEAAQKAQEAAQARVDAMNEELELFIAQQDIRARTLEEELALEQQISDRRKAILQQELDSKLISQTQYNTEILKITADLAKQQAEIAVDAAQRELSQIENRAEIEREANKAITQVRFDALKQQEEELREARAAYEFIRLSEGVITEQEYQDAVRQIRLDSEANLQTLLQERKAVEIEQRDLDFESQILALEGRNASIYELETARIEQQRQSDIEAARQKYTDESMLAQAILNINAEADQARETLSKTTDKAIFDAKLQILDGVAQILGEETALGKAAAIARVAMTTYESAMNSYNSLSAIPIVGPALGFAAAATAVGFGLAQSAKIAGINFSGKKPSVQQPTNTATQEQVVYTLNSVPPFAGGGLVRGGVPINRSNGDNVLITAKKGEVVLNENQQRIIGMDIFRMAGVPGFATGGMVGSSNITSVQNIINNRIDAALVETIGDAVRDGAQTGSAAGTQQGIVDLSSERYIQTLASV